MILKLEEAVMERQRTEAIRELELRGRSTRTNRRRPGISKLVPPLQRRRKRITKE